MTNSKSTKHALIVSVLAIVMCVAMLAGTTFAWFTDVASTAVNKIQSGILTVDVVKEDGETSIKGDKMSFVNINNSDDILWEPGATFKTPAFKIKNTGTLALKYKIALSGVTGDNELLNVIKFSVVNEKGETVNLDEFVGHLTPDAPLSDALYIQGTMDKNAGNKYQNLTLSGLGITVYATQDIFENDSDNNRYDEDATYDEKEIFFVDSLESLKAAAKNVRAGDEIVLSDDIAVSETIVFETSGFVFNGNGHTISADMTAQQIEALTPVLRFGHDSIYCTGITVKDVNFTGNGGRAMHFHGGSSSVLENVNISGNWSLAINFFGTHGAVMNNCNISSSYENKYKKASVFANEQSANQIILNKTTIDSMYINDSEAGATYANDGIKIVVNSGSSVGTLHRNNGITRTMYKLAGGTIAEVLDDIVNE